MQYIGSVVDFFGGPGGAIGLIVGFVGIILAYVFYRRSSPNMNICYSRKSQNIFNNSHLIDSDFKFLYKTEEVSTLSITRLIFWNRGLKTLNEDDVAPGAPLRICGDARTKILKYNIVAIDNEANKFRADQNPKDGDIALNFDYVDKGEGAVIELMHTGNTETSIYIDGQIKGHGHIKLKKKPNIITKEFLFFLFMPIPAIFSLWLLNFAQKYYDEKEYVFAPILFYIVIVILIFIVIWVTGKIYGVFHGRRSNSLRKFLDNLDHRREK